MTEQLQSTKIPTLSYDEIRQTIDDARRLRSEEVTHLGRLAGAKVKAGALWLVAALSRQTMKAAKAAERRGELAAPGLLKARVNYD